MPSWVEAQLAIRGLLRLARFDADFVRHFDPSPAGALRSFWLALPLFAYFVWAAWPIAEQMPASQFKYWTAMTVCYTYLWILPPLVIAWIAPLLEREDAAPGCIAIYNWASLLTVPLFGPILLLANIGVEPQFLLIPTYALRLVSIAWEAFLLTHALRLPPWQAALASIADYLIVQELLLPLFYTLGISAGS